VVSRIPGRRPSAMSGKVEQTPCRVGGKPHIDAGGYLGASSRGPSSPVRDVRTPLFQSKANRASPLPSDSIVVVVLPQVFYRHALAGLEMIASVAARHIRTSTTLCDVGARTCCDALRFELVAGDVLARVAENKTGAVVVEGAAVRQDQACSGSIRAAC